MMSGGVSAGCIAQILGCGVAPGPQFTPVVQVLGTSQCQESKSCLLVISDGTHSAHAVLSHQQPTELALLRLLRWRVGSWNNGASTAEALLESAEAILVEDFDVAEIKSMRIGFPFPWKSTRCGANPYAAASASVPVTVENVATPSRWKSLDSQVEVVGTVAKAWPGQRGGQILAPPLLPISALGPYTPRWRLRARVTRKSEVRRFVNQRGQGQLFSVDLVDAEGGETRATFFGAAVEKFLSLVNPHNIYEISGGDVKIAKPKFCPYSIELTLDGRSSVEAVADDGSLPQMKFEMVPLVEIQRLEPGRTVDIAAVVLERQEPTDMPMKRGGSRQLRRLVLGDMSGC